MSGLPTLETICVLQVAQNIVTGSSTDPESLTGVPDFICIRLLALVLQRGALTPKIAELFAQSGHDTVLDVIKVRTAHTALATVHLLNFQGADPCCLCRT